MNQNHTSALHELTESFPDVFNEQYMSANPQTSTRSLINSGFFNKIQKVANSIFIQMCFPYVSTTQSNMIVVIIY